MEGFPDPILNHEGILPFKMIGYFEDTKGVIRIRKSKQDRQHNGQKKKDKRTNNDLQNITHNTKDRVTQALLSIEATSGAPEGWAVPASLVAPVVLIY